jgi:L-lysine exporter family protein LysE/ArgO
VRPFGSGFLLSLSLCLDLGLVNVAIVRTALNRGGKAGFLVGAGSCVGDLVYFVAALIGVGALMRWPPFRWAVWIGGTAVLVLLAAKMIREVLRPRQVELEDEDGPRRKGIRLFVWGMALALSSPTAILWFAAVGGGVIAASGGVRSQLLPFATGFFAAGIAWSAVLAGAGNLLQRVGGTRVARVLAFVSALLFLYFAFIVFQRGWADVRAIR